MDNERDALERTITTVEQFEEAIKTLAYLKGWHLTPSEDGSWFWINYQSRYKEKIIRIDRLNRINEHENVVNIVADRWQEAFQKAVLEFRLTAE